MNYEEFSERVGQVRTLYAQLLGQESREWTATDLAEEVRSSLSKGHLNEFDMDTVVNRGFDSLVWDGFISHNLNGYVHVVQPPGTGLLGLPNRHAAHYLIAVRLGAARPELSLVERLRWVDEAADARLAL